MKVAVFSAFAVHSPHFETELEIAQNHIDAGDDVTILTCGGELESCDKNWTGRRSRCLKCIGRLETGLGLLEGPFESEPFYRLDEADHEQMAALPSEFESLDALKSIEIDGFDIGYAVASSLISQHRDPDVDVRQRYRADVARLMRSSWAVHRSIVKYVKANAVDRMYLFNGRLAIVRPVLRVCQAEGIDCFVHERGRDLNHYALFESSFPHDLTYLNREMWRTWEGAADDDAERRRVAVDWFERRVNRKQAAGQRCFTGAQRDDLLPDDWDDSLHNVILFVSSEDEFAAVGDVWNPPIYATQCEGIGRLAAGLKGEADRMRIYVRIHPNLAGLDNQQTRALAALDSPVVRVVGATSPISTYALMRRADTVACFGSTTGVEAAHLGKPSVLLAKAYYGDFGATYNPATHEEALALLRDKLPAKDSSPALMYAYYFATLGQPFRHFSPDGFYAGLFRGVRVVPSVRRRIERLGLQVWERLSPRAA